jgi:formylglycine-generating enzyme required for sulfatase activity
MAHIPSATFSMGDAIEPLATPVHSVTLGPYSIDKYEVTVGQYRTCVNAGVCAAPVQTSAAAVCNWSKPGREAHPINCVTWQEAKAFCAFAGKRLPSEAEWEYAARGGTQRWYPWGNDAPSCSRATFTPKGGPQCSAGTSPVGSHAASVSPFGLFDMAGNVEEWVWDVYAPYTSAAQVNPFGPTKAGKHVIRGGNWNYDLAALRTFARWYTDSAGDYIGFRCAKSG